MALTRTNLATNPHAATAAKWTYQSGTGGAATLDAVTAEDTPDGRAGYARATITTADTAGYSGPYYRQDRTEDGNAGDALTLSIYIRVSEAGNYRASGQLRASGAAVGPAINPRAQLVPANKWTRLSVTVTAAEAFDGFQVWANSSEAGPAAGATVDATMVLAELDDEVGEYFDGGTRDTKQWEYDWTGDANASMSTALSLLSTIAATVLTSSTKPPPVQLTINDVRDGDTYSVTGIAPGGRTWEVAGGHGVSEGVQVVLVDNRAPVNVPIRYRLVTPTGTYDSNTVIVPWTPDGTTKGKFLVQSLDGRTMVPIAAWIDNQLPKQPVLNTTGFDIRGRRRPVMVLAVAGEGTMTVQWRLDRFASAKLDQIIADGGGIALRTDGTARDLPVSDVAVITSASSQLWAADNGVSTDRVWDLELTWIDDPEPSTVPVVWDVGDVDAILAGKTVADVDALFAGMTVAEVDAQDWGAIADA